MAKTHLSLSHNPDLKGCPKGTKPTPQSKRSENELCIPKLLASMQISLCSRGTFLCLSLAFGGDIPEKKTEGGSFIVGLTATWVPLCKARSLSAVQSMKLTSLFILRFHSSNP